MALFAACAISPASAADNSKGDAVKGKSLFNRCAMCHSNAKGAPNRIGPNLFGVVGRKSASMAGFSYSGAMKKSGIVWSADKLQTFVTRPAALVPGTKMSFPGVANQGQVSDIVAYLTTLK
ncbi:MAG TPA: cytochrome c family protein [Rhizomicrobium sp.]|nr:cytochrome c family protein [Rhizomicrobium sp.]